MPFCPSCREEYRPEIAECPACGIALVPEEELPETLSDEQIIAAMADEDLVAVVRGPLQACRELQDKLVSASIPAAIRRGEELMTEMGLFIQLELVIRRDDVARAADILQRDQLSNMAREGLLEEALARRSEAKRQESEGGEGEGGEGGEGEGGEGGEDDGPMACPACGSTAPLQDGECPDCGLYLGEEEGEDDDDEAGGRPDEEADDEEADDEEADDKEADDKEADDEDADAPQEPGETSR